MAEMERQLTQEMAPFWVLKVCYTQELLMQLHAMLLSAFPHPCILCTQERNICQELDLARSAVESLVQQVPYSLICPSLRLLLPSM